MGKSSGERRCAGAVGAQRLLQRRDGGGGRQGVTAYGSREVGRRREVGAAAFQAVEASGARRPLDRGGCLGVRPGDGVAGIRVVDVLVGAQARDRVVGLRRRMDLETAQQHRRGQQRRRADLGGRPGALPGARRIRRCREKPLPSRRNASRSEPGADSGSGTREATPQGYPAQGVYNAQPVQPRTHLALDRRLCGRPVDAPAGLAGSARVELTTVAEMAADAAGLVHGGFVFGLADHAAMLAVNDPNVVLGSAAVRFLLPVAVGERLIAEANVAETAGRKSRVLVEVRRAAATAGAHGGEGGGATVGEAGAAGEVVMSGEFVCFTLERHALAAAG